jgi:signal peptidase I
LLIVSAFFVPIILGLIRVVPTPSMAIGYTGYGYEWAHPFDRTIQVGDIVVIQPVNPADLNANYPNSDIIVYHTYDRGDIVHRIVAKEEVNGTLYFYTKGDANPINMWPAALAPGEYDKWAPSPIPQDMVVGKVILRIPWIGNIALFIQDHLGGNNSSITIPIVAILIALLIIVEFILPLYKRKKTTVQHNTATAQT